MIVALISRLELLAQLYNKRTSPELTLRLAVFRSKLRALDDLVRLFIAGSVSHCIARAKGVSSEALIDIDGRKTACKQKFCEGLGEPK